MQNDRLLRLPLVESRVGLKRSAIYSAMEKGQFPRPVRLGKRAVAWIEREIQQWIESRSKKSGEGVSNG